MQTRFVATVANADRTCFLSLPISLCMYFRLEYSPGQYFSQRLIFSLHLLVSNPTLQITG